MSKQHTDTGEKIMAPRRPTPTLPAETESKERAPRVTAETVQFGEIAENKDEGNPFATGSRSIPSEHPLMVAVKRSFDNEAVVDVNTPDADALIKFLRRCAAQQGYGIRTAVKNEGKTVTFLARPRQSRPRKAKADATA